MKPNPRVCYFGTYRAGYARNRIMIEGLRRNGLDVVECHEPLWRGTDERVEVASGGWLRPGFLWRVLRAYARLLWCYRRIGRYDVLVVAYPGVVDVYPARLLSWIAGKPLVWDVLNSVYLLSLERGLERRSPTTVRLLRWVERTACRLPDLLILDTSQYVAWFQATHDIAPARFRVVPLGADDRAFRPNGNPRPRCGQEPGFDREPEAERGFRVLYYGTFLPNHGVEHIIEAACLLAKDDTIEFELIGSGPDRDRAVALARANDLKNVTFVDWLTHRDLAVRAAAADVCLGAFGTRPQSLMTVHNKVFEGLAMAKPVITGDSPAVRATFTHSEHVYLCRPADPPSLAEAIVALRDDPELRTRLARNGHRLFVEEFDLLHNGGRFAGSLRELVG